jgi:hypothetical protein
MDYIRRKVSGNRRRYTENGYSLDLTYITSRVMAMSYPSSGIEGKYRNPIETVSQYLNEKHGSKYWIINTSERATYDKEKYFNNQCSEYHWPDHHGPPFHYCF